MLIKPIESSPVAFDNCATEYNRCAHLKAEHVIASTHVAMANWLFIPSNRFNIYRVYT
jgi:hypothetical protein